MTLEDILNDAIQKNASDIHLLVGDHPALRIYSDLTRQPQFPVLTNDALSALILPVLPIGIRTALEDGVPTTAHTVLKRYDHEFRLVVYRERGNLAATLRVFLPEIPALSVIARDALPVFEEFANLTSGLILLTGPTGSGKQTTSSALVEHINREKATRIFVIEESGGYHWNNKKSLVSVAYVGQDIENVAHGLNIALHTDPNIILTTELPDTDAVQTALTLANTGHLVIANLHAERAPEALIHLISLLPKPRQPAGQLLARTLRAVVNQRLLPHASGKGRTPAYEILRSTPEIQEIIRRGEDPGNLFDEVEKPPHISLRKALHTLREKNDITAETAAAYQNPDTPSATYKPD